MNVKKLQDMIISWNSSGLLEPTDLPYHSYTHESRLSDLRDWVWMVWKLCW